MADQKKGTKRAGPGAWRRPLVLDLRHVGANTGQTGRSGVVQNLNAIGYGLFENSTGHDDETPLWTMLTCDDPALWATAVGLIDEFEPDIRELAETIAAFTQLHNVGVVAVGGAETDKRYDVKYGMRRCIARAYNHARSLGDFPLTVKAELVWGVGRPG